MSDGENGRLFLEDFARSRGLDPLCATSWYSVKYKDIVSAGVCQHTMKTNDIQYRVKVY